jgi:hypothetical protein
MTKFPKLSTCVTAVSTSAARTRKLIDLQSDGNVEIDEGEQHWLGNQFAFCQEQLARHMAA